MSHDTHSSEPKDSLRSDPAYWAVRLSEDITPEEREQFQQWLLADERNAREFRIHSSVLTLTSMLPAEEQARLTPAALSQAATEKAARRRVWMAGIAATLLVALLGTAVYFARTTELLPRTYATETGQNRTLTFKDTSVAYLNTRTRLKWMGGFGEDRRFKLIEGEVLFDVAQDQQHPFRVLLDNSEIRVLGTRFNVYRKKSGEVEVSVLEGAVEVHDLNQGWTRQVKANQSIAYQSNGLTRDVQEANVLNAVKWRDGVLEIDDESLPQVLEELNRYTDKRLLLRDPRLAQWHFGGALSVRDIRVALKRIEKLGPVVVAEHDNTFTLDYQPKPGDPQLR